MQDKNDPNPDADEVREGMHSAVQRLRKQFAETLEPEPPPDSKDESVPSEGP